jgi:hypothetical protein
LPTQGKRIISGEYTVGNPVRERDETAKGTQEHQENEENKDVKGLLGPAVPFFPIVGELNSRSIDTATTSPADTRLLLGPLFGAAPSGDLVEVE